MKDSEYDFDKVKDKASNLHDIAMPVINFIKENYDLHTTIVINTKGIKVVKDDVYIHI